jgi:hypothetical protein
MTFENVSGNVDFEDLLCSFFCQPCTLSQMAVHTGAVTNDSPVLGFRV